MLLAKSSPTPRVIQHPLLPTGPSDNGTTGSSSSCAGISGVTGGIGGGDSGFVFLSLISLDYRATAWATHGSLMVWRPIRWRTKAQSEAKRCAIVMSLDVQATPKPNRSEFYYFQTLGYYFTLTSHQHRRHTSLHSSLRPNKLEKRRMKGEVNIKAICLSVGYESPNIAQ